MTPHQLRRFRAEVDVGDKIIARSVQDRIAAFVNNQLPGVIDDCLAALDPDTRVSLDRIVIDLGPLSEAELVPRAERALRDALWVSVQRALLTISPEYPRPADARCADDTTTTKDTAPEFDLAGTATPTTAPLPSAAPFGSTPTIALTTRAPPATHIPAVASPSATQPASTDPLRHYLTTGLADWRAPGQTLAQLLVAALETAPQKTIALLRTLWPRAAVRQRLLWQTTPGEWRRILAVADPALGRANDALAEAGTFSERATLTSALDLLLTPQSTVRPHDSAGWTPRLLRHVSQGTSPDAAPIGPAPAPPDNAGPAALRAGIKRLSSLSDTEAHSKSTHTPTASSLPPGNANPLPSAQFLAKHGSTPQGRPSRPENQSSGRTSAHQFITANAPDAAMPSDRAGAEQSPNSTPRRHGTTGPFSTHVGNAIPDSALVAPPAQTSGQSQITTTPNDLDAGDETPDNLVSSPGQSQDEDIAFRPFPSRNSPASSTPPKPDATQGRAPGEAPRLPAHPPPESSSSAPNSNTLTPPSPNRQTTASLQSNATYLPQDTESVSPRQLTPEAAFPQFTPTPSGIRPHGDNQTDAASASNAAASPEPGTKPNTPEPTATAQGNPTASPSPEWKTEAGTTANPTPTPSGLRPHGDPLIDAASASNAAASPSPGAKPHTPEPTVTAQGNPTASPSPEWKTEAGTTANPTPTPSGLRPHGDPLIDAASASNAAASPELGAKPNTPEPTATAQGNPTASHSPEWKTEAGTTASPTLAQAETPVPGTIAPDAIGKARDPLSTSGQPSDPPQPQETAGGSPRQRPQEPDFPDAALSLQGQVTPEGSPDNTASDRENEALSKQTSAHPPKPVRHPLDAADPTSRQPPHKTEVVARNNTPPHTGVPAPDDNTQPERSGFETGTPDLAETTDQTVVRQTTLDAAGNRSRGDNAPNFSPPDGAAPATGTVGEMPFDRPFDEPDSTTSNPQGPNATTTPHSDTTSAQPTQAQRDQDEPHDTDPREHAAAPSVTATPDAGAHMPDTDAAARAPHPPSIRTQRLTGNAALSGLLNGTLDPEALHRLAQLDMGAWFAGLVDADADAVLAAIRRAGPTRVTARQLAYAVPPETLCDWLPLVLSGLGGFAATLVHLSADLGHQAQRVLLCNLLEQALSPHGAPTSARAVLDSAVALLARVSGLDPPRVRIRIATLARRKEKDDAAWKDRATPVLEMLGNTAVSDERRDNDPGVQPGTTGIDRQLDRWLRFGAPGLPDPGAALLRFLETATLAIAASPSGTTQDSDIQPDAQSAHAARTLLDKARRDPLTRHRLAIALGSGHGLTALQRFFAAIPSTTPGAPAHASPHQPDATVAHDGTMNSGTAQPGFESTPPLTGTTSVHTAKARSDILELLARGGPAPGGTGHHSAHRADATAKSSGQSTAFGLDAKGRDRTALTQPPLTATMPDPDPDPDPDLRDTDFPNATMPNANMPDANRPDATAPNKSEPDPTATNPTEPASNASDPSATFRDKPAPTAPDPAVQTPATTKPTAPDPVPDWQKAEPPAEPDTDAPDLSRDNVTVDNAGLVLLWPFLEPFMARLGLTADSRFVSDTARARAAHLCQYLVTGASETPEHRLALNKLFCGIPLNAPLPPGISLSQEEEDLAQSMLTAVCSRWPPLVNTDINGLRGSFLIRQGLLGRPETDGPLILNVETAAYDMLLDQLPWSIATIRLPWMSEALHTKWR